MHNCAAAVQVLVAYALSIEVFYDSEPDMQAMFGVLLALAATIFYFISAKDRELKPDGMAASGGKYHVLASHE
jgi:hypothetical protein